jgi:hypothetical protein
MTGLTPGDQLRLEIDGIGVGENRILRQPFGAASHPRPKDRD